MTTLDDLVKDGIAKAMTSEAMQQKIQAAAEEAITAAMKEAFGWNSDFRKSVGAAVTAVLPMADKDDLATFADAVRTVLQTRLALLGHVTAQKHVGEVLDTIISDERIITLSDLETAYRDKVVSHSACHCDGDPEFLWETETSENDELLGRYWYLLASEDPAAGPYDNKTLRLGFACDHESKLSKCFVAHLGKHSELVSSLFVGPLYGFDAMVFRLRSGLAQLSGFVP